MSHEQSCNPNETPPPPPQSTMSDVTLREVISSPLDAPLCPDEHLACTHLVKCALQESENPSLLVLRNGGHVHCMTYNKPGDCHAAGENLLPSLSPQRLSMPLHSRGPGLQLGFLSQQPPPPEELVSLHALTLSVTSATPTFTRTRKTPSSVKVRGTTGTAWVFPDHNFRNLLDPICLPILLYGPASCQNNSTRVSSVLSH